ncbi:MAG: hypothetical protein HC896_12610 [Bacteroidales bacterium]|nr:hypothetical protein [Bacteroidales bacterium]
METSDIKQRLSIEKVLSHYGLQANRNNMLKCPFHEEKEPSLKIYPPHPASVPQGTCGV